MKQVSENDPKNDSEEVKENDDVISIASSTSSRSSAGSRTRRLSARRKLKKLTPGYHYDSSYTESHHSVIYGAVFNHFLAADRAPIFATVGANNCSVYECRPTGGIALLLCYADPDAEEAFFASAWSYDKQTMQPLLIAGGNRGVIRIINVNQHRCTSSLIGHGGAINQLKVHPTQCNLLLSCSKDYGIRFWNMKTNALIAIFGGVEGHRAEVLSVDIDLGGGRIISGGMDHALKIWDIQSAAIKQRIELSRRYKPTRTEKQFPTLAQHYPDYSTREIHGNYVDCVQWFGDFIISKSCQNSIVVWRVDKTEIGKRSQGSKPEFIAQFKCQNCELWFVRFDFNIQRRVLACGNELGKIYVWELNEAGPQMANHYILSKKKCKTTIRQVAFSQDAKVLIAVCDDATIWRWNKDV